MQKALPTSIVVLLGLSGAPAKAIPFGSLPAGRRMSFRWRRAAAQDGPEDLMDTVIRWEDCITVTADTTIHIITDTTIPPISRLVTFSGCGTIRDPSETERGSLPWTRPLRRSGWRENGSRSERRSVRPKCARAISVPDLAGRLDALPVERRRPWWRRLTGVSLSSASGIRRR
jgi:hypothetical protein